MKEKNIYHLSFTIHHYFLGDRDSNPDRQIQKLQSYH